MKKKIKDTLALLDYTVEFKFGELVYVEIISWRGFRSSLNHTDWGRTVQVRGKCGHTKLYQLAQVPQERFFCLQCTITHQARKEKETTKVTAQEQILAAVAGRR